MCICTYTYLSVYSGYIFLLEFLSFREYVVKFIDIKLYIIFLFYFFNICRICNDAISLIPDSGNVCFLSFPYLARSVSIFFAQKKLAFGFIDFFFMGFVFFLLISTLVFILFFCLLWVQFALIFLVFKMQAEVIDLQSFFFSNELI